MHFEECTTIIYLKIFEDVLKISQTNSNKYFEVQVLDVLYQILSRLCHVFLLKLEDY